MLPICMVGNASSNAFLRGAGAGLPLSIYLIINYFHKKIIIRPERVLLLLPLLLIFMSLVRAREFSHFVHREIPKPHYISVDFFR
jgi:hypothetical protein